MVQGLWAATELTAGTTANLSSRRLPIEMLIDPQAATEVFV